MKTKDPLKAAIACLKHISNMQLRWGKQYDVATDAKYNPRQIGESAAIVLSEYESSLQGNSEELTLAKRQLTAALAREGKQKKKIARLEELVAKYEETSENPEV